MNILPKTADDSLDYQFGSIYSYYRIIAHIHAIMLPRSQYAGKGSTLSCSCDFLPPSIIFTFFLHAHVQFIPSKHEHLSNRGENHFPHDQLGKGLFSQN